MSGVIGIDAGTAEGPLCGIFQTTNLCHTSRTRRTYSEVSAHSRNYGGLNPIVTQYLP